MKKRILFVGGGTAGHVAPLLAVMKEVSELASMKKYDVELVYVGTDRDKESPLIKASEIPFMVRTISSGKLHRFLTWDQFRQVSRLAKGVRQAKKLVRELKPDAIVAKGGYVTVPVVWAARKMGIPIFSHETDSLPGLANRIVARWSSTIFTAYPAVVYPTLPPEKIRAVGQPVRAEYYTPKKAHFKLEGRSFSEKVPMVTVICGSQGARRVNELIFGAWKDILAKAQLVHIVGPGEYEKYAAYAQALSLDLQERLWVVPFIQEVAEVFKRSNVVVARSGGTIAELAATHMPSILIPLSTAAQDHQRANARVLERAGAAIMIEETTTTSKQVFATINDLLDNPKKCHELAEAISRFDHPHAAQEMAGIILDTIC